MASKTPRIARLGCIIGGLFTFLVGIPFAVSQVMFCLFAAELGTRTSSHFSLFRRFDSSWAPFHGRSLSAELLSFLLWTYHLTFCIFLRVYYGPDSIHGVFATDTCASQLGLPTCALWEPDKSAFIKLLTHQAPDFLGGWCLIGIIAASMSTADGAILAMGTVFSHNVVRQFDQWYPWLVTPENLLFAARVTTVPFTLISSFIAAFYRSSHSAGATGYLLIVAFDITFATVVVPLFGCFYAANPSPRAALLSILGGAITRIVLEFTLPKDGYLLLPWDSPSFLDVGPGASADYPAFYDVPDESKWDEEAEPCIQERFTDYTGVDSISAFVVSLILFVGVQFIEWRMGRALFEFAGSEGYIKDTTEHPLPRKDNRDPNEIADLTNKSVNDESSGEDQPHKSVVSFDVDKDGEEEEEDA